MKYELQENVHLMWILNHIYLQSNRILKKEAVVSIISLCLRVLRMLFIDTSIFKAT